MRHEAGGSAAPEEILPAVRDVVVTEQNEQDDGSGERQHAGNEREGGERPGDDHDAERRVARRPAPAPVSRAETRSRVREVTQEIDQEEHAEEGPEQAEVRHQRWSAPTARTSEGSTPSWRRRMSEPHRTGRRGRARTRCPGTQGR